MAYAARVKLLELAGYLACVANAWPDVPEAGGTRWRAATAARLPTCTDRQPATRANPSNHDRLLSHNPSVAGSSPARPTLILNAKTARALRRDGSVRLNA